MKKSLILLFVLAIGFASTAYGQGVGDTSTPYVNLFARAERTVEPDRLSVMVTLSEADSKGKTMLATLEQQFARALKEAGINAKENVVLDDQSSQTQKRQQIYQYKVYTVTVNSVMLLNNFFETLKDNGVGNVSISRVWNTKEDQIRQELQVEAIKDAQVTAQALASAVGQQIGKAIMIDAQTIMIRGASYADNRRNMMSKEALTAEILEVPDQFRKLQITQSVTVRFELK